MKRLLLSAILVLGLTSLGVVHPRVASASTGSIHILNVPGLTSLGIHSDSVGIGLEVTDGILAEEHYCADGTSTCRLGSPNFTAFRTAVAGAQFDGNDPARSFPFSLSGNTPDELLAVCEQGYIDSSGDDHVQFLGADPGSGFNSPTTHTGTITGKAVVLPTDTSTNTFAYGGMNVAGTDTTLGTTINYMKGNQYSNNETFSAIGGSGFQISLTGTILDANLTTDTIATYPGTLTCSTGRPNPLDNFAVTGFGPGAGVPVTFPVF